MTPEAPNTAFGHPLTLQRPALCPEIALWLMAGEVDLERACHTLDDCHPPPYWAFCWGAGQALARFVLDHPEIARARAVVDFGAGCGVVAIAAALAGASRVCAVDSDPAARAVCLRNATANGVTLSVSAGLPEEFDVLLAADVLYEPGVPDRLREVRASGHAVYVADPGRAGSHDLGLPALVRHAARTLPDVDSPMCTAAIFVLP